MRAYSLCGPLEDDEAAMIREVFFKKNTREGSYHIFKISARRQIRQINSAILKVSRRRMGH